MCRRFSQSSLSTLLCCFSPVVRPDANIVRAEEFPMHIEGALKVSKRISAHLERSDTEDFKGCRNIGQDFVGLIGEVTLSRHSKTLARGRFVLSVQLLHTSPCLQVCYYFKCWNLTIITCCETNGKYPP